MQSPEYNRKVSQSIYNMSAMTKENCNRFKYFYKPKYCSRSKQNLKPISLKTARMSNRRREENTQTCDNSSRRYSDTSPTLPRPLPSLPQENLSKPLRQIPLTQYILQVSHSQLSHHSETSPPTFGI